MTAFTAIRSCAATACAFKASICHEAGISSASTPFT